MADKTIGSLPAAPDLYDDSLLAVEQQGQAVKLTGAQIKGFARQGVSQYVQAAQDAASEALEAVGKVGDSVEQAQTAAQTAQEYSGKPPVIQDGTWWTWNAEAKAYQDTGKPAQGPQGEQGIQGVQGPEGKQGPIGPQGQPGADGTSFVVKGRFGTLAELESAHPAGQTGDAYAVGTPEDNTVYLWSADAQAWQDVGSLQGPEGPEGKQGPVGPQGPPGSTEAADAAAQAAQTAAEQAAAAAAAKQDKLTGTAGQVVGFNAEGVAVAQDAPDTGVVSFKGRKGAVMPQNGDYTAAMVSALPVSGGTLTGDLRIKGPNNYGTKINLGDGDYVHISEPTDDCLEIKAKKINFVVSDTSSAKFTLNGKTLPTTSSDLSIYAPKQSPIFYGSISLGRISDSAIGNSSFVAGVSCAASGDYSQAVGFISTASGEYSHACGYGAVASGMASVAFGQDTKAAAYAQMVIGRQNVISDSSIDQFIIGNGTSPNDRANTFRVTYSGVFASGNYNSSGADYAELFEWLDANPDAEDRAGHFVTLVGDRIRLARPEDSFILGIVSATPSVVGDVYDDQWQSMYLRDVFGRTIMEMQDFPAETTQVPREDGTMETVELIPARRELAPKLNPDYDHTIKYLPRTQRPEWDAVGMMGKLVAVDDGTCQVNGWCAVGEGGKATHSDARTRYRVMARLDDTHIRVLIL